MKSNNTQIIHVESYCGLSGFTYTVTSNGRELQLEEVKALGLVDTETLLRHKKSDYIHQWYEIKAGDQITVTDDDSEKVYEFLHTDMHDFPKKIDDYVGTPYIEGYLEKYCRRVK